MVQINVSEATGLLAELVEAALRGETVLITKNGQETVQLVPVPSNKPHPVFGSAKGLIHFSEDFDAPLEDFNEYMQ
jgi:prevent-host-death family protein